MKLSSTTLQIAMAALAGLMAGTVIGGTLVQSTYKEMTSLLIGDRVLERYVDAMHFLKLLDDGKVDAAKQALLNRVQDQTPVAVDVLKYTPESKRQTLRHYVRISGTLKSVQNDDSELGRTAAAARNDPVVTEGAADIPPSR